MRLSLGKPGLVGLAVAGLLTFPCPEFATSAAPGGRKTGINLNKDNAIQAEHIQVSGSGPGCTKDTDCDDGLVCTKDTCVSGSCVFAPDGVNCQISRNFYNVPYKDGTFFTASSDFINHGGSMDFEGPEPPAAPAVIVAAADGVITWVQDGHDECGFPPMGTMEGDPLPCVNFVNIAHANGETSCYWHLKKHSARNKGIVCGMFVTQGTEIGIEGDVGITGGNDRDPNSGPCYDPPPGTGQCEGHLHWAVHRSGPDPNTPYPFDPCCNTVSDSECVMTPVGQLVNPMTCGINGNIYIHGVQYLAFPCGFLTCLENQSLWGRSISAGGFFVEQAKNVISASDVTIENSGSLVLHAGAKVTLTPGFLARFGSYFRAEIGACDTTAVTAP